MVDLPSLGSFIYGPEGLGVTLNWILCRPLSLYSGSQASY